MLGCQRLVRCAWCLYLAAMGVVGSGTRSGFATNEMAVPLARTVCLSAGDGRISVHVFDAAAPDRMALYQNNVVPTSREEPRSAGQEDPSRHCRLAEAFWGRFWIWLFRTRV